MKIKTDNEPVMPSFNIPGIIPDIPDIPAVEAEEVAIPDIVEEPKQEEQAAVEPVPEIEEKKPKKKKAAKKDKSESESESESEDVDVDTKVEEVAEVEAEEEDITPIAVPFTDITEKKLKKLKEEHKKIFRTNFADSTFVWHRLNRQDFNKIAAEARDIEDREERFSTRERSIIRATVVFPHGEDLEHFLQEEDILTTSLSEEILYHSGFIPPQTDQL